MRMNRNQYEVARRARVEREVREYVEPSESEETILALVEDWIADELADEDYDRACDRELCGEPEDTPCLEGFHCDDAGTGEGRFHGRI